jgi:membrane protease YdiL (CAAX protease family)
MPSPPFTPLPARTHEPAGARGLFAWLWIVAIAGGGGLLLGQAELAGLAVLAGLFACAQAADFDPRWQGLDRALAWLLPLGGAFTLVAIGVDLYSYSEQRTLANVAFAAFSLFGAALSLLTYFDRFADTIARRLFGEPQPGYTSRLAARLIVVLVLVLPPGALFFRESLDVLVEQRQLLGPGELWSSLVGFVILALGSTGFLIQRDLRQTLRRLGLGPVRLEHLGIAGIGVFGLFVVNSFAEWMQHSYFPRWYEEDQRINTLIAGQLTGPQALLLGLSAGIGEEISMRGALQPKLGLVLTSLLFAGLHVQYSWFGVGVIAMLGFTLGWIRRRTNTTVAILVHAAYDAIAVLALQASR